MLKVDKFSGLFTTVGGKVGVGGSTDTLLEHL